jgi:hypothetical protein
MIYRIEAWISLTGDRVLAGEMVCEIESDGRGRGTFRYASDYLKHPNAFALDPISLPLRDNKKPFFVTEVVINWTVSPLPKFLKIYDNTF